MNIRALTLLAASFLTIPGLYAGDDSQTKTDKALHTLADPVIRATSLITFAVFSALWARAQHKYSALAASTYKPRLKRAELTRALDAIKGSSKEDNNVHEMVTRQLDTIQNKMTSITDEQASLDLQRWVFGAIAALGLSLGVAPAWRSKQKKTTPQ